MYVDFVDSFLICMRQVLVYKTFVFSESKLKLAVLEVTHCSCRKPCLQFEMSPFLHINTAM